MKVVFFRHSLLSRGGDKMVVAHASHLARAGHEVTIKTSRTDTVFRLDPRVRVVPLRSSGKIGSLVAAATQRQDADLVIADIIVLACLLFVRNGRKTLYFAQDYDESYYSFLPQRLFIRGLYLLGLTLFRVRTIAVARELAELLTRRFRARVAVVENGVDTSVFFPEPDPELVAIKEGRKAVLLLSRSDSRKGFDVGVAVVNTIAPQFAGELEIWTVGAPAQGLFPGRVHRDFGYVNEDRLRRIMSSAALFLYPSRHEGLPLMPLEAMSCGCPVVTTTAVPYANNGQNALVSAIDDVTSLCGQVQALLAEPELGRKLVASATRLVTERTLDRCLTSFQEHLENLEGGHAS